MGGTPQIPAAAPTLHACLVVGAGGVGRLLESLQILIFFFIDKELLLFKASSPLAVIMPLLEKFVYTPLFAGSGSS